MKSKQPQDVMLEALEAFANTIQLNGQRLGQRVCSAMGEDTDSVLATLRPAAVAD
jgi:hypothetical protein